MQWPIWIFASFFGVATSGMAWFWGTFGPAGIFIIGLVTFLLVLLIALVLKYLAPGVYARLSWGSVEVNRMPLLDFLKHAEKDGWDISGRDNLHIMDLLDGLRQQSLDGVIRVWGRPRRSEVPYLVRDEPLNEIEKSHWKDFEIPVLSNIGEAENFASHSYNPRNINDRNSGSFVDIHLERYAALRWLKKSASAWRGRKKLIQ